MNTRSKIRTGFRFIVNRIWPPEPKPLILMYHRIADEPVDPWDISVSPNRFEEHLRVIRRTRYPLPLTEFVERHMTKTLQPNAVALTFDDGYVDNLTSGKPLLASADVPATVFLATGYIGRPGEFWWDELTRLILLGSDPLNFALVVDSKSVHFDLGSNPTIREDGTMSVASPRKRQAAMIAIWEALRRLGDEERELAMAKLRSIFSTNVPQAGQGRAMTREEVRRLVTDGLITIGAHTVTHPALSELEAAASAREINESKVTCEALIGAPVAGFAYPFGDLDIKTREAVRAAGFAFACCSRPAPTIATSDLFALPRIQVRNHDGGEFERALRST